MGQAWGFGRYGGPEVQEFFERPDPVPGRGEVLIRVDVAGVNPLDHLLRSGLVPGLDGGRPFPRVLGVEAAGTGLALGEDVDGLEVGDAVFGFALTGGGTYAETTVLEVKESQSKPDRGTILVETRAYNQHGKRVCVFRRRVLIPKRTPENQERFEPRFPKEESNG